MTYASWISTAGGRRFLLVVGTYVCTVALTLLDKVGESIYRDITLGLVAAYALANTVQKIKAGGSTND